MAMRMQPHNILREVEEKGFAFLPRYYPGVTSIDVAGSLGLVTNIPGLEDVQVLRPREACDAPPNIYSGIYGLGAFPLHTDLAHWYTPPRYLLLRCIEGTDLVATYLIDGHRIAKTIGEDRLQRALVQPRRPINGQHPLLHLLEYDSSHGMRIRWDERFIIPATPNSIRVCEFMRESLGRSQRDFVTLQEPGDMLVVDNWRMLHGRSSIPKAAMHREIERIYLGELKP